MTLQILDVCFSVCKLPPSAAIDLTLPFVFVGKTAHELSVVLPTESVPSDTLEREDGWKALRFACQLDFSLIGILSRVASLLAENGISIFAVSTYDTDYILMKDIHFEEAVQLLRSSGYRIE